MVGVAVLVGAVLVADPARSGLGRCDGEPEAVLLPTADEVPDVVGLAVATARERLAEVGLDAAALDETWRTDPAPRGRVLAQSGGACGEDLALSVSTGGPLVPLDDLPLAVRSVLATAVGTDGVRGPEPLLVREVEVADGAVWATDALVSGQCRHVAVARQVEQLLSPAELSTRDVRCVPDSDEALLEALRTRLPDAEVWQCEPGTRCRLGTADGGWYVEASVRRFGTTALPTELRCAAPTAYDVCELEPRDGGGQVRTVQSLGKSPPGRPYLTRRVRLVTGPWQVDVLVAPRFDESGPLAERPTATPFDGEELRVVAELGLAAVREVSAP